MKRIFLFLGTLTISGLYAQQTQVGINTSAPKATLDIQANPNTVAGTNEGILIPRLSKEKVAQMTDPETSTLVYVNDISFTTTEPKVAHITKVGFYHYNGTQWIAGLGDDTSIYTQSGTLIENRTVGMNGKNLLFTGNGNIGIDTSTPSAKLDVNGKTRISNSSQWIPNQVAILEFSNGSNKPGATAQIIDQMNGGGDGGDNLLFTTQSPTPGVNPNLTEPTEKMRITAAGNVGIGTNAPIAKLHVAGGEIMTTWRDGFRWVHGDYGMLSTNDGNYFYLIPTSQGNPTGPISRNRPFSYNFATKNLLFMTGTGDGNIGIGTNAPIAKLDIAGNVKIADGTQGEGKVLTSDANGKASWKTILTPSFDGIPDAVWTVGGANTPSMADLDTNPVVYSTNHPDAGGNSFSVNKTGWYVVWSRWYWRQRLPVSGVIDQGNAFAWIQINTDPGPYMDGPGMVYEYRTVVNRVFNSVSPPSGFLVYLKANQPYYIHQVTVNTEFPSTGERNFRLYFVQ